MSEALLLPGQTIAALAFWVLSAMLLGSALMVVLSRSPVHSVLLLISSFFSASGLLLLLGAELLAMLLIIVYVGAVAVLFLFVVMMLDMETVAKRERLMKNLPLGLVLAGALLVELVLVALGWREAEAARAAAAHPAPEGTTNARALGELLYDDFFLPFQTSGLALLVAVVGAVVLTHRTRPGVRRQSVAEQASRPVSSALRLNDPPRGGGVHWDA